MGEIIVETDSRYTKRKMLSALGGDLAKILTELITNADDSYRRLEHAVNLFTQNNERKAIYIMVDKKNRRVEVIDNAEGMDEKTMEKKFEIYGSDKSEREKGYKTRGLFGQGASDVLFSQKEAFIKSIKDGNFYTCKFGWNKQNKRFIDPKLARAHVRDIRRKYLIPHPKNGTIVSFTLNKDVKYLRRIEDRLRAFYMLRFILSDPSRKAILYENTGNGKRKSIELTYNFPEKIEKNILYENKIKFSFEEKEITGKLTVISIENKEKYENVYGDLKILVYDDEKNVYDNTFFDSEKLPGTELIYGYLKLDKTAGIIRDKLNEKRPEEILSDKRDGFNKQTLFYKQLNNEINPIIKHILKQLKVNDQLNIDSSNYNEWNKAFKELNKYIIDNIDDISDTGGEEGNQLPKDGLKFIRERIKITIDKKYSLKLLINPEIIPIGSEISINAADKDNLQIINKKINVLEKNKNKNGIVVGNIYLCGKKVTKEDICIEASYNNGEIKKTMFVSVIDSNIHYPKYGLEFYPNFLSTKSNHNAKLHLYFDTKKFPIKSKIFIISTNENIILLSKKIKLTNKNLIFDDIGVVDVLFKSKKDNQNGKIVASCNNYSTTANIIISNSKSPDPKHKGLINGWELENRGDSFYQKYFNRLNGKVMINVGNYINKYYFGESIDEKKIEKDQICQRYLAELISEECAICIVNKKIENGKIDDIEYENLIREQQKEKNNIAKIIYKTVKSIKED